MSKVDPAVEQAVDTLGLNPITRRRLLKGTGLASATLAASALLVASGRPGAGLAVTFSTAFHILVIRYLQRPSVKALFA